jgi:PHD/YefM family antitoxin component YafN of YafNO toxin-antitoxin module
MNLTEKQIEAARAGQPVVVETKEAGRLYLLSEELYRQVMNLLQSEPEQEAFRNFSMRQAGRIASENADS